MTITAPMNAQSDVPLFTADTMSELLENTLRQGRFSVHPAFQKEGQIFHKFEEIQNLAREYVITRMYYSGRGAIAPPSIYNDGENLRYLIEFVDEVTPEVWWRTVLELAHEQYKNMMDRDYPFGRKTGISKELGRKICKFIWCFENDIDPNKRLSATDAMLFRLWLP